MHTHAPGIPDAAAVAAQHGANAELCNMLDLEDINPYDSKAVAKSALQTALHDLPYGETDWSHDAFPWWVFLAGRRHCFNGLLQEGITAVAGVRRAGGDVFVQIVTKQGVHAVHPNGEVRQ